MSLASNSLFLDVLAVVNVHYTLQLVDLAEREQERVSTHHLPVRTSRHALCRGALARTLRDQN